jgi:hypothetical protein
MISSPKVTEIYFIIDEFFKEFDKFIRDHSLARCKNKEKESQIYDVPLSPNCERI